MEILFILIILCILAVVFVFLIVPLLTHLRVYTVRSDMVRDIFKKTGVLCKEGFVQFKNRNIFYRESGNPDRPAILFIHGSPGSGDTYIEYLADAGLVEDFHMLSFDRPGYGRTGGNSASLNEQVEVAFAILQSLVPNQKAIIVGHSYGGTIAVALVLKYPQVVERLVLLAPAIDYIHERSAWLKRFSQWVSFLPIISDIIAQPFRISANEMHAMPDEMSFIASKLSSIHVPILHIMGDRDFVVPYGNIAFAKKHFDPAYLTIKEVPKMTHFIPQKYPLVIKEALLLG